MQIDAITMQLSTPQNSAGVLSFYDAPEKGPSINPRIILALVAIFAIVILIFDHASLL